MDQADNCRRAAAEAVADVEPPRLHDRIDAVLDSASMLPGVLTLESAAAVAPETTGGLDPALDHGHDGAVEPSAQTGGPANDPSDDPTEAVLTHAAGVQLIYEGLRLTRSLSHDPPWADSDDAAEDGDLTILAADILVARGFYLLARTDAAGKAVRTVQAFGRDQTRRDAAARDEQDPDAAFGHDDPTDPASIDANLERDVLELAVLAGAAAVDETPSTRLLGIADQLADTVGTSLPAATDCLARFETPPDRSIDDPTTDRATSATDP
ncbi:hypothetical protein ACFO5R_19210 [Halosolutus amylolyticus]|uniref:Uncharacterized protein n=1 Tax=Halosolutus amylolyticus TaxID=2932267 RepID=A0ABD5PTZ9_9EURY|nr:hypothetical protein [Halosolutus amylolyticus]